MKNLSNIAREGYPPAVTPTHILALQISTLGSL
jgi:hypothetical protein